MKSNDKLLGKGSALFFIGLMLIFLMVLSSCSNGSSLFTNSEVKLPDTISVSGFGQAVGKPDMVVMQLGVNVVADQIGEAIDESNSVMGNIKMSLLGAGIAEEDLQTTNFNVWFEDRYDPMTGQSTGERLYHVDNTLQVKVRDIDQTPQVLEKALEEGANNIYGLNYEIEDRTALEAEARSAALGNARIRADQLAREIGVTLGEPIYINEGYSGGYVYPVVYEAAFGGGGPPISAGQLTIGIQVNVTYSINR
jgi:uncharacterized protein YggE